MKADIHREIIFRRHAVLTCDRTGLCDALEHWLQGGEWIAYTDHDRARTLSRPPQVVSVMPTDGLGQMILWAE